MIHYVVLVGVCFSAGEGSIVMNIAQHDPLHGTWYFDGPAMQQYRRNHDSCITLA